MSLAAKPPKQVVPVVSDCDGHAPCEITKINGGCPPPLFLHAARIDRIRGHIENGDHEEAANELFASRMGAGMAPENPEDTEPSKRRKRHSDFEGFETFDTSRDNTQGKFYQHEAPVSDGYGAEVQYKGMGRYRDDRRSFGIRNEDRELYAFRPLRDDMPPARSEFGGFPSRRRGPVPDGPRADRSDNSEFGPRPREVMLGRVSFGPGSFGPYGPDSSSFEQPKESSSSSSSESSEERPPFRHHGYHHPRSHHHRRFPAHHRHTFPFPPPFFCHRHPWVPFCRFGRRGVGPQTPPPCGPFGKCVPSFGGPKDPFDIGALPIPAEAASGWIRPPMPPPPPHRPFGPRPDRHHKHAFIVELLHGTTCASVNGTCLCCCGPYIPNVENGSCVDLRDLIPRIDDLAEALQKATGNPESQPDLDGSRITSYDAPRMPPGDTRAFEKIEKPDESF